jgi:hypothetical protein
MTSANFYQIEDSNFAACQDFISLEIEGIKWEDGFSTSPEDEAAIENIVKECSVNTKLNSSFLLLSRK